MNRLTHEDIAALGFIRAARADRIRGRFARPGNRWFEIVTEAADEQRAMASLEGTDYAVMLNRVNSLHGPLPCNRGQALQWYAINHRQAQDR